MVRMVHLGKFQRNFFILRKSVLNVVYTNRNDRILKHLRYLKDLTRQRFLQKNVFAQKVIKHTTHQKFNNDITRVRHCDMKTQLVRH